VTESLISSSGISLGASRVGLVQLRHREVQEEGRREAPRQALRPEVQEEEEGCLLHALDNLGRAAA
jgi:hypothetical protein